MLTTSHGGDLPAAVSKFGCAPWLDLSTSINPWSYQLPQLPIESWRNLPTSDIQNTLRTAAAHYYSAGEKVAIASIPGTQALIQRLPHLSSWCRRNMHVVVVTPTYNEHAIAWSIAGHHVICTDTLTSTIRADIAIIVNPNNPDGHVHPPEWLCHMARTIPLLIVDESFADVDPHVSFIPFLDIMNFTEKVIVLRSFGKFFGLAGIRLGFALTGPILAKQITDALGPWAVTGPAMHVGTIALSDSHWISTTRTRLHRAAIQLDITLKKAGLTVVGGTDLFRLVDCGMICHSLYKRLGHAGILVRTFSHLPFLLRFGLPGRSQKALEEVLLGV